MTISNGHQIIKISKGVFTRGYDEILKRHEEEASKFSEGKIYFIFASNENELIQKLEDKGLTPQDVRSLGGGGYIKKEYVKEFNDLLIRHAKEKKEYTLNNIYEVVSHYCWDYELYISISYDLDTMLTDLLNLTPEEIQANDSEIKRAWRDYKREFEKLNI